MQQPDLPYFSPHSSDVADPYYILPLKPPIALEGVSARVFPLRANIDMLQRFVDDYMNFVPPEVGRFRAMIPYVHLMMLDYGKLAVAATNLGWFAQREFLFCVPVEWYTVERNQWVFRDWAAITPFIYVDSDASMSLGRTVYGWTKNVAHLTSTLEAWMNDPLAPVSCATVSTMVFPDLYRGSQLEERVFLEVERQHEMSNFQLPFDALSPIAPWAIASKFMEAFAGFNRDAVGMLRGFGVLPTHTGTSADNYGAMVARMMQIGFPLRPDLTFDTLNLKQFRQSDAPWRYCYQALTKAGMKITKFNRGGLLGEQSQLLGDTSGGYSIKIHEWPSLPIIGTLGLEESRRWQGQDAEVVELKPVSPFWYDVNMDYQRGMNLAYRGDDGVWHEGTGRRLAKTRPSEASALRFNTTLGSSIPAVAGPFTFSKTTIRVLPLIAKKQKLETFLDEYLNDQLKSAEHHFRQRFSLWGGDESDYAYVYLTVTSFGDMTSLTNNVGDWANYELAFLVPVKRECLKTGTEDEWELAGVGLVPAFTYVDKTTAAVARSEVLGIPTLRANFMLPAASWMSEGGSAISAEQQFLQVDAEVLPALFEGQKAETRTILGVRRRDPEREHGELERRVTTDRWCDLLKEELRRKYKLREDKKPQVQNMLVLALELLGNHQRFAFYTLKQFRDVFDPDRACYQALARVSRVFTDLFDLREIEVPLAVTVHDFPTQPLCERLGLFGRKLSDDPIGVVWELEPIRPFTLQVTMDEHLGEQLLTRSSQTWERPSGRAKSKPYLDDEANVNVGLDLITRVDVGDPRALEKSARDFSDEVNDIKEAKANVNDLEKMKANVKDIQVAKAQLKQLEAKYPGAKLLEVEAAKKAIEGVEPQVVIETILSREWGNWSENARWKRGLRELRERHERAVEGQKNQNEAEKDFFDEIETGIFVLPRRLSDYLSTPWNRSSQLFDLAEKMKELCLSLSESRQRLTERQTDLAAANFWGLTPDGASFAYKKRRADKFRDFRKAIEDFDRVRGNQVGDMRGNIDYLNQSAKEVLGSLDRLLESGTLNEKYETARWPNVRKIVEGEASRMRERCENARETYFTLLSGAWEKPDFVVRRDAAGSSSRERIFPLAASWDADWYSGLREPGVMPVSRPTRRTRPGARRR